MPYFSPYIASQPVWKNRAPADCTPAERKRVLDNNVVELHRCDLLVPWLGPDHIDTGTAWEMGYFYALGHGFTLAYIHDTDARQSINLMLAGTVDAVARGRIELRDALHHLSDGAGLTYVASTYDPARLTQERTTIT